MRRMVAVVGLVWLAAVAFSCGQDVQYLSILHGELDLFALLSVAAVCTSLVIIWGVHLLLRLTMRSSGAANAQILSMMQPRRHTRALYAARRHTKHSFHSRNVIARV
jgi:hypothetical protein